MIYTIAHHGVSSYTVTPVSTMYVNANWINWNINYWLTGCGSQHYMLFLILYLYGSVLLLLEYTCISNQY